MNQVHVSLGGGQRQLFLGEEKIPGRSGQEPGTAGHKLV